MERQRGERGLSDVPLYILVLERIRVRRKGMGGLRLPKFYVCDYTSFDPKTCRKGCAHITHAKCKNCGKVHKCPHDGHFYYKCAHWKNCKYEEPVSLPRPEAELVS